LRKSRPQSRLIDEADHAATATGDEGFAEEDARRVHAALDKLSAGHREVLLLRFIEDLSYEEIAQVTGCHIGTVRSRIHYAKRLLRREMEGLIDHG
jgi:RNA polymerase sigma-70 factor (ECF subfamily)